MTNGQRLILWGCVLLLCGYLSLLAQRVVSFELQSTGASSAEKTNPKIVDAVASLSELDVSIAPYRHGVLFFEGASIRIERNGDDGFGVFLVPNGIRSNRIIRFEAKGDARIIVRSTISGERHYRNTASDDFLRITPQTDEVLVFTNDASSIDLLVLSAIDCAESWDSLCADPDYLIAKIGLLETRASNKEELLKILDWTANSIVWSDDIQLTSEANALLKKYGPAQTTTAVFEAEAAGGSSQVASAFLCKVLSDLGYEALTVNFGISPNLTHVSTLVHNPFGDGKFYMLDPTFNAIFVDERSGEWIPFDDLLAGKTLSASILERPVTDRRFLVAIPSLRYTNCRPAKGRSDRQVCWWPDYDFEAYIKEFEDAFAEAGLNPDGSGYMRLLRKTYYSVGNQAGSEVQQKFLDLLETNDIAFAKQ
ncbi:MAG: hypothetical protein GC152_12045 [Alphaproteobacteria bacterium]|nr:hypothetical protein [Alphaproteobacteria bacterium]